jgi:hypothetical protein
MNKINRLNETGNITIFSLVVLGLSWWACLFLTPYIFAISRWEFLGWSLLTILAISIIVALGESLPKNRSSQYPITRTIDPSGWD